MDVEKYYRLALISLELVDESVEDLTSEQIDTLLDTLDRQQWRQLADRVARYGYLRGYIEGEDKAKRELNIITRNDIRFMESRLRKIRVLTNEMDSRLDQFRSGSPSYKEG